MKIKINTHDLQVGMYVCELDRPWTGTPFMFQGFEIQSDDDIEKLRKLCREVYVLQESLMTGAGAKAWQDWKRAASPRAKSTAALEFEQELLKLNNHPNARSVYDDETTLEQEVQLVKDTHADAKQAAREVLQQARLGHGPDGVLVRRTVRKMVESVLRNPDALMCYAHLRHKDDYQAMHALRCSIIGMIFGRQLGMEHEQLELIGMAGLLHDIGMVKVPDELLTKPDRLSPIELAIVRRHVTWGGEILERGTGIPYAAVQAARNHHERYNGSGYPRGLAGDAIGEIDMITAIVDYYDAVTSERSYQSAVSLHAAMRAMYAGRAKLFHSQLLERFIQCLGVYPIGSVVQLNTGEVGVVVGLNRRARLKPRVMLVRQADQTLYPVPSVVNLTARRITDDMPCDIERVLDPADIDIDPVRYLPISDVA